MRITPGAALFDKEVLRLKTVLSQHFLFRSTLKYSGGTVTVPDCSALTLGAAHLIFAAIAEDYDGGKRVADDVRAAKHPGQVAHS